jgi:hypothetical protein
VQKRSAEELDAGEEANGAEEDDVEDGFAKEDEELETEYVGVNGHADLSSATKTTDNPTAPQRSQTPQIPALLLNSGTSLISLQRNNMLTS